MPPRTQTTHPDPMDKESLLAHLKAENKSVRRQLTLLRGKVHDLEAKVKHEAPEKAIKLVPKPGATTCICGTSDVKTCKTSYKDIHVCFKCGTRWVGELKDGSD